jgi:hypothetical protein
MRGNITRRGKFSWRLKFDIGNDPVTGERRTRTVTVRCRRQDAEAELARLLNDAHKGTLVDVSKVTVEAYLWGWLDGKHGLSPVSVERYREIVARGIVPRLGAIELQELKPVTFGIGCPARSNAALAMAARSPRARFAIATGFFVPPSKRQSSLTSWPATRRTR